MSFQAAAPIYNFWTTPDGINIRLDMLSEYVQVKTYNRQLRATSQDAGVKQLEWIGETDEATCDYCDGQNGRHYWIGQFIPEIPSHPGCRCSWIPIKPGEEDS